MPGDCDWGQGLSGRNPKEFTKRAALPGTPMSYCLRIWKLHSASILFSRKGKRAGRGKEKNGGEVLRETLSFAWTKYSQLKMQIEWIIFNRQIFSFIEWGSEWKISYREKWPFFLSSKYMNFGLSIFYIFQDYLPLFTFWGNIVGMWKRKEGMWRWSCTVSFRKMPNVRFTWF